MNKKRIVLIADAKNWAFDMIAQIIKQKLSNYYDIAIDYFDMHKDENNFYEFLEKYKDFDLMHFFWRKTLLLFENDKFKEKVKLADKNYEDYVKQLRKKISTCVYDHFFLENENLEIFKPIFNEYSSNYYVATKKLYDTYLSLEEYRTPNRIIHDICDWNIFLPENLDRFDIENLDRKLVIGWVGNSERKNNDNDLKGLHTIVKPVIEQLKQEGYNICEDYADRNIRWRTTEEMPEYYSNIDICLCASIYEGTPRPVLEAMSCGVPVISTDVGIVPEVFGKKQKLFNIGDRQNGTNDEEIKKILKQKIIELYNDRRLLKELSEENIESIKKYDSGRIISDFQSYFEQCLNSNVKKEQD